MFSRSKRTRACSDLREQPQFRTALESRPQRYGFVHPDENLSSRRPSKRAKLAQNGRCLAAYFALFFMFETRVVRRLFRRAASLR